MQAILSPLVQKTGSTSQNTCHGSTHTAPFAHRRYVSASFRVCVCACACLEVLELPQSLLGLKPAVRAVTGSRVRPLLWVAAMAAFWSMGVQQLHRLAEHLGVHYDAGSGLFQVLHALVMHVTDLGADEALDIIRQRLREWEKQEESCFSELLACDEAVHYLSRSDQDEMKQDRSDIHKAKQSREEFLEACSRKREELHGKSSAACKKKLLQSVKVGITKVPKELGQDEARQMLPPGGAIWQEVRDAVWRGRVRGHSRISRSSMAYGDRDAARLVLKELWARWLSDNDLQSCDCPVHGLMD